MAKKQEVTEMSFWQKWTLVVAGGLVSSINGIALALAFAVLTFRGDLEPSLATGITIALTGSIIIAAIVGIRSSMPGMIANVQDVPGVILALVISAIAVEITGSGTGLNQLLPTAIATIAITSILIGSTFWLLGKYQLGNLVRFVPYPVMGGFLAATGWILFVGGVDITVQVPSGSTLFMQLFQPDQLVYWVPAVVAGLGMYVATKIIRHYSVLPLMLLSMGVLYLIVITISGLGLDEAAARGFLLHVPENAAFSPVLPQDWLQADWLLIARQLPLITVLVLICVIAMLLNVTGIEMSSRLPVQLNQDLRGAGLANLLSGIAGGAPGYHLVGMTSLTSKMGVRSRWTGAVAAMFMAVPFFFGAEIVNILPKALLGGMLVYLGIDFLYTWIWQSRSRLSVTDYAIIWIILVSSHVLGFLQAIGVGIVVASILFMVRYLRISVIRNQYSGADYRSRRERTPSERRCLRERGDAVSIYQLQGYIFFGTAQQLLRRWEDRVRDPDASALEYAIFDCHAVTGWDSSALFSINRLAQLAEKHNVMLLVCGVTSTTAEMLRRETLDSPIHQFSDLDAAVEWCEGRILSESDNDDSERASGQLLNYLPDPDVLEELLTYFVKHEFQKGAVLIEQNAQDDAMMLVESGEVTVVLRKDDNSSLRLRSMGPGSIAGELALFGNQTRAASVVADSDVTAFSLSRAALRRMEAEQPSLANKLHRAMSALLAERLVDTTSMVRALSR